MYQNSVELMRSMREAGIDFRSDTPVEDDNLIDTIRVGWQGSQLPPTTILFRVNDRGCRVEVESVAALGASCRADALALVNELNCDYRWMTFRLTDDNRVAVASDVYLVPEVAGLFGIAAMGRMFDTLDEVYPRLRGLAGRLDVDEV
ncbi:MAG: hypothetical protein Q4B30_03025 [Coriobacteriaceae bacterium]|nr:hypothetical protein [Coriobacteriaceae bacterium]